MTTRIQVPDASCGLCKSTIESAVGAVGDVTLAELDLSTKTLTVEHDASMDIGQVTSAIREAGYTPERVG
ncbi:MAG TPA: heavy metal-associated domain-containing protein [Actinomycetota bacterium]|jgi:copper chaperone